MSAKLVCGTIYLTGFTGSQKSFYRCHYYRFLHHGFTEGPWGFISTSSLFLASLLGMASSDFNQTTFPAGIQPHDLPRHSFFPHSHRKTKVLKALDAKCRYVLSKYVILDMISELYQRALIGNLDYFTLKKYEWVAWAMTHWSPL